SFPLSYTTLFRSKLGLLLFLLLNFGRPLRFPFFNPLKNALNAFPKSRNGWSEAFLVTSHVQGNCSRLIALNCFFNERAVGFSPASYCRFHSASAQFHTNLAVPAALAK